MADTRGLLNRITAFRERLENLPQLGPTTPPAVAASLSPVAAPMAPAATADPMPVSLTARARRLLNEARELIDRQRQLSADRLIADEAPTDTLSRYHRGTVGLTEAAVRLVQTFPVAAEAQLRACEGLDQLLRAVRDRLTVTDHAVAARRIDRDRIDRLAGLLASLNRGMDVSLEPFAEIAESLLDDARRGGRIRVLTVSAAELDEWFAAKSVAAHSLTVAQVAARVAHLDYEWAARPFVPVVAALVMDVGMLKVAPAVFAKSGALDAEERRAVDAHPRVGADLVGRLVHDAGPLAAAVGGHHERLDGTGYPAGERGESLPPLARFLAVCDVYAGMTSDRPHRPAADPRTALTDCLMLAEEGILDRDFTEYLLTLGFHPVGTVVELTDGRLAVVAAVHSGRMNLRATNRPVVAVLSDADGRVRPRPEFVDLATADLGGVVRALPTSEKREKLAEWYPDLCG